MDTTAANIAFDSDGICNYCSDFLKRSVSQKVEKTNVEEFIRNLKNENKNKPYDCIVGVSGGVDSSYALYKTIELGLRPLAVHLDNGWNSELAQSNISNLVNTLKVDLYTHVVDWEEYKNLQQAFFDSNVLDIELLLDNAMLAINYKLAKKYKLKYILSGTNTSTEGFKIPSNWSWFKNDAKNIKSIAKKFRNIKPKTLPIFGTHDFIYYELICKIKWILFLDFFNYKKEEAITLLKSDCNYKPYPYKHYESVFTRFYQGYILPKKFGVDKRKLHLSNLICSEQLTRADALKIMEKNCYENEDDEKKDINFFLKKMEWSKEKLDNYINEHEVPHDKYGSEKKLWDFYADIYKLLRLKLFFN